jgi:hypothetical protein
MDSIAAWRRHMDLAKMLTKNIVPLKTTTRDPGTIMSENRDDTTQPKEEEWHRKVPHLREGSA